MSPHLKSDLLLPSLQSEIFISHGVNLEVGRRLCTALCHLCRGNDFSTPRLLFKAIWLAPETFKCSIHKRGISCESSKANDVSDGNKAPIVPDGEYTCLSTDKFPANCLTSLEEHILTSEVSKDNKTSLFRMQLSCYRQQMQNLI